jgi:DNA-dependent RNA polymerase auxiliary subunit epsilon
LVNSQGSIEMVMGNFLLGPPLKEHKTCLKMSWNINEEFKIFYLKMLNEVYRILKPDGIFLIYGNVCKNSDECDVAIRKLIKETKFNLEYTQRKTLYRLRKLDESIITS